MSRFHVIANSISSDSRKIARACAAFSYYKQQIQVNPESADQKGDQDSFYLNHFRPGFNGFDLNQFGAIRFDSNLWEVLQTF